MNLESQKITNHDLLNHLSKVLFPRRSSKMIDGRVQCNCQLVFELQSLRVFEKRSNLRLQWNMYFKLVGILWTFVGIREHRFVLHVIWEEKCLKQAEPFLMWLIRCLVLRSNFT